MLVGLACLGASLLRLGFIANLISKPVLIGYLAGISLTLFVSQLPSVTRVTLHSRGLVRPFIELARKGPEIHWPSVVLAVGLFVLLRVTKRITPRIPGPAVAVILALLLSVGLDFGDRGFATIGVLPAGLPAFRSPVFAGGIDRMILSVMGLLVVSFASGILTARAFGQHLGVTNDPNRELRVLAPQYCRRPVPGICRHGRR